MSKLRGASNGVPPYVSIPLRNGTNWEIPGNQSGYLGIAHRPFSLNGPGIDDLRLPADVTGGRLADRNLLRDLGQKSRCLTVKSILFSARQGEHLGQDEYSQEADCFHGRARFSRFSSGSDTTVPVPRRRQIQSWTNTTGAGGLR